MKDVFFELQCAAIVSHREPLQRIAKEPRALKAARRILERTFPYDQQHQYIAASHRCEAGELRPREGCSPLASLVLDGRTYVLAAITCYEGCNGFEIHEVTANALRPVINRGSTAACD